MSILFSNKQLQTWVVDGRVHLIFPDKVQEEIKEFTLEPLVGEGTTVWTVDAIDAGTYCLHYVNFVHDLDMAKRMPVLMLDPDDATKMKPMLHVKFPSIEKDPSGILHMTYWTNVNSNDEPCEPFSDSTGEVSEDYTRAVYYVKGLPRVVRTNYGGEGEEVLSASGRLVKIVYFFSTPVQIYKPAMWSSSDTVEPVLDVHTGSATTSFLQFTPEV